MTKLSLKEQIKLKRQQTSDKKMGAKNAYKFKGGVTTIRLLPTWNKSDPSAPFFHEFGQTFIKNMEKQTLAVIGDQKLTYGKDDVVRGLIQRAMGDATTDAQREHWKDMLAKPRVLCNALILDDRECDPNTPEVVDFSETQFDAILEQIELNGIDDEVLDFEKGFNLKVSKTGTGFNTKYSFTFDRKATPISPSVMDNVTDIDAYIRSKFSDTERAVNAIKSLTQGTPIGAPTPQKALSYSGDEEVVEGDYSAVEEASSPAPWEDDITASIETSDEAIEKLFK